RNIAAHYDLGNDLFALFLDDNMMYSSALFEADDDSLETASTRKLDRICRKLGLRPEHHVLEIGTGWGGFAIHAASVTGCRVTTATISEQQYEYTARRVYEAGLTDRVTVLRKDYRDFTGRFDRVVSLEMVEAVGHEFYPHYFAKCGELLRPGGELLLQAIVMPEQRYQTYLKSVDFIQKYIFPGGCLPSITAMQDAVTQHTSLRLLSIRDFAGGYAQTLQEWRKRFHQNLSAVRELGCDERFIRMWDYYFAYCEGAFEERAVGVVQAVWGR
ncbi:MAG: class I SAM-dependent methyltransferase, partial [Planctomycetaceae bacterium]|nr:class I SAM-dependent methyltransferase [Planctomycetaceae bacterium]